MTETYPWPSTYSHVCPECGEVLRSPAARFYHEEWHATQEWRAKHPTLYLDVRAHFSKKEATDG